LCLLLRLLVGLGLLLGVAGRLLGLSCVGLCLLLWCLLLLLLLGAVGAGLGLEGLGGHVLQ
jgi:hypothetical protein